MNSYRHDYNHVRPHEAIAWNRPADVYTGTADPTIPNFENQGNPANNLAAGQSAWRHSGYADGNGTAASFAWPCGIGGQSCDVPLRPRQSSCP